VTSSPSELPLSAGFGPNPRTFAILDGTVSPLGIRLLPTAVHGSELFWRQLKFADFDVSEMSISSLTISTAQGQREWIGLPVFSMRRFFHTGILVREGAGIEKPADLKGKRVGVPEYQQTAAVWCRGILSDEFGVDPRDLHWFMERPPEQSHGGSTGFKPPPGVKLEYIPTTTNIGEMLLNGTLDATLLYLSDPNLVDRSRIDLSGSKAVRPLFPNPQAEAHRYFAKTGIYPINHCFVVRRSIAERDPQLAARLYHAFVEAKSIGNRRREGLLAPWRETGLIDERADHAIEADVMAYGVNDAKLVLDTVTRFIHEQELTPRRVALDELFAPGTLD
jgi:4,5-dihydroxyphthalate decarboxylase